jgi:hypothetical protein
MTTSAFYKGESQEKKFLWRLEGAKMFAVLSSPCCVASLRGFVWLWIHLVVVTAHPDSEARQAAWSNRVNHGSI